MSEIELMLSAWRQWLATGSNAARDVALEIADRIRTRTETPVKEETK